MGKKRVFPKVFSVLGTLRVVFQWSGREVHSRNSEEAEVFLCATCQLKLFHDLALSYRHYV